MTYGSGELDGCVQVSRLLGSDPSLVLHGGGNSSVKVQVRDITGRQVETLYVKGSGWDMATIEPAGFTGLRLERLRELLELESLTDRELMRELAAAKLDPGAPQPSVESLLHSLLPHRVVLHSHADAILTLTNLGDPDSLVRSIFGSRVLIVPYVMPGFALARRVRALWSGAVHDGLSGMVLLNHGLFTFGDSADEAYDRHLELITMARAWLDETAPLRPEDPTGPLPPVDPAVVADLRRRISAAAGRPLVMRRHADPDVARFVRRPDVASLAARGPLTPDHVIRTRRVPMVGQDVERYGAEQAREFEGFVARRGEALTMLDLAPRVVLDPGLGMLTLGETACDAGIAADVYRQTMAVLVRAEDQLGGYVALPASDILDMEYWELEQAKLRMGGAPGEFAGHVAMVTGAASGIGRACAGALLERGACVVGIDRAANVPDAFGGPAWLGVVADVTDPSALAAALAAGVDAFGGLDILVPAAGTFGPSRSIASMDADVWRGVLSVNLDGVLTLMRLAHPLLARSPVGGRVVVIGSKNVRAPGAGAAAYSASKAAVTQLVRVAAMEWASDGIRVNVVHPDAVFDTGLWTEELLAERAERYGLTVEEYKRRNLLHREIASADVARLVAAMCGDAFLATTGAQVPIDGGNERTI